MIMVSRLLLSLVLSGMFLTTSPAAERVALVIGNGAYQTQALSNPPNDAEDMAVALRRLGFDVIHERDATLSTMKAAVRRFGQQLAGAQVGLFYYAGHGIQQAGNNYLLPVDSDVASAADLEFYALNAQWILSHMEQAGARLNIVILDACRNHPFRSWQRGTQDRGLARMEGPRGTVLAYATQPGNVAADGVGRNGTYTHHLLAHLEQPGVHLQTMFNRVGLAVQQATTGKQDPWLSFSSIPEFCLAGCGPPPIPTTGLSPGPDPEADAWAVVKDSKHAEDVEAFLQAYPRGRFAVAARLRLQQLRRAQPEAASAPEAPVSAPSPPAGSQLEERSSPPLVLGRTEIQQAQERLQVAGLNPGPADGLWGRRTEVAIRQFQTQQGLPATGQLDAATQERLKMAVGVYPPRQELSIAWPPTLRNSLGMEFVLIQAGEFQMGSNDGEAIVQLDGTRRSNEQPVHRVRISRPFYLGKYEVTQAEWVAVMGTNPSYFKGDPRRPVEQVSWEQVQAFIERLNAREGHMTYRLPTEAEWEYAARAGTTTAYSFGKDARQLGTYAWCSGNIGSGGARAVGGKRPNAWGLYDMHGNVEEWVQDWHGEYPAGTVTDPQGPQSSLLGRVTRGGGWGSNATTCRSAFRQWGTYLNSDLGFRLLRTAP